MGICADNQFAFLPKLMHEQSIDIMLMPHAAPLRRKKAREDTTASEFNEIEAQYARMKNLPHVYARTLGVPVLFATQVGNLERLPGIIGRVMTPEKWCIPGISRIVDSDNVTKAEMDDNEGFVIAEVALDPDRKAQAMKNYDPRKKFNGFNAIARKIIFPLDGVFSRLSYHHNNAERKKRQTSAGTQNPSS